MVLNHCAPFIKSLKIVVQKKIVYSNHPNTGFLIVLKLSSWEKVPDFEWHLNIRHEKFRILNGVIQILGWYSNGKNQMVAKIWSLLCILTSFLVLGGPES